MQLPTVMGSRFSAVPGVNIQRSKFNRSHGYKTTFDGGYIVPFFVDEALPGDTLNLRVNMFCRLATPIKPVMDNMKLTTFFFSVPIRLIWNNWEKFNGAQDNPGDSTSFTVPQVQMPIGGPAVGSLFDYFGIPSGAQITGTFNISAFWSRAYNLIYNQWFRDENMQNSVTVDKGDGPDNAANYVLKRRGKRHDYFTSCLPWPQKGTAVTIPVGANSAPVLMKDHTSIGDVPALIRKADSDALLAGVTGLSVKGDGSGSMYDTGTLKTLKLDPNGTLYTDLSSALATTINQLRLAEMTQVLLERDARGGTRYAEILKSHFGVTSPDARLQRPEYLGGGVSDINVHPVPQSTPAAGGSTPQGNLAAFGTGAANGHGFNKSFVEHCVLIGLVHVGADLTYQQGLDRMWSRSTRFDFYWPALANIGEQSVLNKEIYLQGAAADANVFGYQERYGEYRFKQSLITGKFRSTYATPLDMWHLSQKFTALPTLGDTFISDTPPIDRVIAVNTEPHFLMDAYFNYTCARPMPVYGIPGLGQRF